LTLLTEDVLLTKPAIAVDVLEWFNATFGSKKIPEKLVVRPNVRAFLEHRFTEVAKDHDQSHVKALINLLQKVNELLPFGDVTVPGATNRLAAAPGGEDLLDAAGFLPFPYLPDFDDSPAVPVDADAVAERGRFLVDYLTNLSVAEADQHRRFLVLHGGNYSPPPNSEHIIFRSAEGLLDEHARKTKQAS
jgi:hypothetical protein